MYCTSHCCIIFSLFPFFYFLFYVVVVFFCFILYIYRIVISDNLLRIFFFNPHQYYVNIYMFICFSVDFVYTSYIFYWNLIILMVRVLFKLNVWSIFHLQKKNRINKTEREMQRMALQIYIYNKYFENKTNFKFIWENTLERILKQDSYAQQFILLLPLSFQC